MVPKSQRAGSSPIYHMLDAAAWAQNPTEPYSDPSLAREGFIHFSGDPATLMRVANAFYREQPGEWLILEVDPQRLAAPLRWESVGEGLFPHLYGALNREAVVRVLPFPRRQDGAFVPPVEWAGLHLHLETPAP